jgi:altronate dehydratase small subunit
LQKKTIVLNSSDNVASALVDLGKGDEVTVRIPQGGTQTITLTQAIQLGHKFALTDIMSGAEVTKLGMPLGVATRDIQVGEHVHVHNVR